MKIIVFIIRFILINAGLYNAINISPAQSMSYINGNLVIFRSLIFSNERDFISYPFKSSYIFDIQASQEKQNYNIIQNDFIDLYDYKFINPSGESSYRKSTYILGSIKLNSLKNPKEDIVKRFSSVKIDKGVATIEQRSLISAPLNILELPDIEYGSALIGEPEIGMYKSKALLYIMGGSRYIDSKNSLENIKHFSLFNFTAQAWEDLSSTLPEQLSQVAGHQLIDISDGKLIAFGGYKANNYTIEQRVAAVDPSFNSLKNTFVYDIKEKRWERKQTSMTEQDEKVLSRRKHYSTTAKYKGNKLYVYAGFESDYISGGTSHYFGILDLNTWGWKWYQIGFNSDVKNMTTTSFDSILVSDAMIVSHSECHYKSDVKFFKFDLNLGYSNLGSLSSQRSEILGVSLVPKTINIPIGLIVFLIFIAIIIITAILFFLYRYYHNSKRPKEDGIRFETEDVWSDPSIYATQNNNIANEHLRRYRLYQCFIFQRLSSYTHLGQTFSYHEPEFASIHESSSRTCVDMVQNLDELPNSSENSLTYITY